MVMVLDDEGDPQQKYTWGLDLSGLAGQSPERERAGEHQSPERERADGIHGAGGTLDTRSSRQGQVGGLLAVEETAVQDSPSYWFFYDGNGNVGQVISASDQSLAARYEYDPYGNALVALGDYADANPFRFSTKWLDTETGLGYWGERYYWFRLGRWGNRDPIEEEGGSHLSAFVGNDPCNRVDAVGLAPSTRDVPCTSSIDTRWCERNCKGERHTCQVKEFYNRYIRSWNRKGIRCVCYCSPLVEGPTGKPGEYGKQTKTCVYDCKNRTPATQQINVKTCEPCPADVIDKIFEF